ncbi:MAG: hypothetical protein AAGM22_03060 [Acidobacteriota bacterium]
MPSSRTRNLGRPFNPKYSARLWKPGPRAADGLIVGLLLAVPMAPVGAQSPAQTWCAEHGIDESYREVVGDGNQPAGFLCAFRPSRTDPAVADRNPVESADVSDLDDLVCGFGAHAVGFPADPHNPAWADDIALSEPFLYFVGTYVRPYDSGGWIATAEDPLAAPSAGPQNCRRCRGVWTPGQVPGCAGRLLDPPDPNVGAGASEQYESLRILIEGVQAGFLTLQPAHANYDSNFDFCGTRAEDNCSENVRREALLGEGEADSESIDVLEANSLRHRLQRLVAYLGDADVSLPPELSASPADHWGVGDWAGVRTGGHSGGSGYAYYLARNLGSLDVLLGSDEQIAQACLLSGPFDIPDGTCEEPCEEPGIADWYLNDETDYPRERLRVAVSQNDRSIGSFEKTYALLGLDDPAFPVQARILRDTYCTGSNEGCLPGGPDHLNGHPAIVQEESLAWVRTLACFAPIAPEASYVAAPMLNIDLRGCSDGPVPNEADFLAAHPTARDPATGCDAWECSQCGYWNRFGPQLRTCLFDEVAFAAAHPPLQPSEAREAFENGDIVVHGRYCRDVPNTFRQSVGY